MVGSMSNQPQAEADLLDFPPGVYIEQYDAQLAAYYGQQDRNQHPATWSGPIAKRLSKAVRPCLRQTLEEMGFRFD